MKEIVGLRWCGVIAGIALMVPVAGWSKDSDVVASMTLDCAKDMNKKCEECGYTGSDHDPPCCRKPDDCEVINKPLPPIVVIKKPKAGHAVAPVKGAVKAPPKKLPAKSPATDVKAGKKTNTDVATSGSTNYVESLRHRDDRYGVGPRCGRDCASDYAERTRLII